MCVLVTQSCPTLCDPVNYIAHQSPLSFLSLLLPPPLPSLLPRPSSMGFSRQEYYSELTFLSPGDLPDPGIKSRSPALQIDYLPSEAPGKPMDAKFEKN